MVLDILHPLGWRTHGVEPVEPVADAARRKGHDVRCTAEKTGYGDGSFDVVILNHALEHTPPRGPRCARGGACCAPVGS